MQRTLTTCWHAFTRLRRSMKERAAYDTKESEKNIAKIKRILTELHKLHVEDDTDAMALILAPEYVELYQAWQAGDGFSACEALDDCYVVDAKLTLLYKEWSSTDLDTMRMTGDD